MDPPNQVWAADITYMPTGQGFLADSDDLARGARRSGCLVSGIGEAAGSTLNRGSRPFLVCCWSAVMGLSNRC